jgi:uncharacterized membrane protein YjgN (DUF898 family)
LDAILFYSKKGEIMKTFKFEGSGTEYFKIWIVNVLLTILTLGIYYPWAKVRNKRYFYANMTQGGRGFEYHATGKQLIVGYLIAMVLLITYIGVQKVSPIGSLIVLLVFFVAVPWIIWRSLKFNARMTSFSNVHFSFDGGLKSSYVNFFLYPFLFFLSIYSFPIALGFFNGLGNTPSGSLILILGIVAVVFAFYTFGLMKQKNFTYIITGMRYGQGEFNADYEIRPFIGMALMSVLLFLGVMMVIMIIAAGALATFVGIENLSMIQANLGQESQSQEAMAMILPYIMSIYIGVIIASMITMAYWVATHRKYVFEQATLDGKITFGSTLKSTPLAWVMVSNFLLLIMTLGFAYPWTKVRMAKLMVENTSVDVAEGLDTYMTQKRKEESSLGEQIGDAFDVDVGIGF